MAIPVGPMAATATARIVEVIDDEHRWGFAYATLPHHPVVGEESFVVEDNPDDGATAPRIVATAAWRPAVIATSVCPPIIRFLHRRPINSYLASQAGIA